MMPASMTISLGQDPTITQSQWQSFLTVHLLGSSTPFIPATRHCPKSQALVSTRLETFRSQRIHLLLLLLPKLNVIS